ncbi:hypothetical protein LCGC14_1056520 [marine sediment metagenome]|uniref:Uncharacterized protein n=1 Tax=marine sediment metagenome TaxID=412755 RepID=A0A0F9QTB8_9ZZZZ
MTKEKFFERNKNLVNRFVRGRLAKTGRTVHGTRATNAQLPRFLERKPTVDWDVFAKNPKKAAMNMEKFLDKKFRGDFFDVREGATKRLKVHKVFSNVTGDTHVDFSIPDRKVPTVSKRSVRFATLKDQFEKAKSNLKDPTKIFRTDKDRSLVRRVEKFEKLRGKKL